MRARPSARALLLAVVLALPGATASGQPRGPRLPVLPAAAGEAPSLVLAPGMVPAPAVVTSSAGARPIARGFVIGIYSDGEQDAFLRDLDEIRALGADSVLFVVQQAMRNVRSTEIVPRAWLTPSDARLERALAAARQRGLAISLMPTLLIEETEPGEWRGRLAPRNWAAWWTAYEDFILRYARLGARHGVATFCVGSELCSTEAQEGRWGRLLGRVREVTSAKLTYSFNWDHLGATHLAASLDVAGTNLYHDLTQEPAGSADALVLAWEEPLARVAAWQAAHGRPVVVTEIGFRSVQGAEVAPWDYLRDLPYDGEAQRRCYEALIRVLPRIPALAGVHFYAWRGEGGTGDTTYTPRGKPAAELLRRWFRSQNDGGPAYDDAPERSPPEPAGEAPR